MNLQIVWCIRWEKKVFPTKELLRRTNFSGTKGLNQHLEEPGIFLYYSCRWKKASAPGLVLSKGSVTLGAEFEAMIIAGQTQTPTTA